MNFKEIDGLTIENRVAAGKAIPDDVLAELKTCHVILKGPTTTPEPATMAQHRKRQRRHAQGAATFLPTCARSRCPNEGIDWTFFRENTEGAYALGCQRRRT